MKRVLVANRGAVARRIIRAAHTLGIEAVAVYSTADANLPYLQEADAAVCIGEPPPLSSYLNQDAIMRAVAEAGADAVHPGYGFLAENADFATRVHEAGLCFIGPSPKWISMLGHKTTARELMKSHGMPMTDSSEVLQNDLESVRLQAMKMGFPLLLKPANGGGGIGMVSVRSPEQVETAWNQARSLSSRSFGSNQLYFETLIDAPRHIEFQFLADRHGGVRCLFERDCSTQRRHQKVLEEAPAPNLPRFVVDLMAGKLEDILSRLGYDVIGTVEMLYSPERGFSFIEVNTRLQVEHAVTEEITGIDIVAAQIQLAGGARVDEVLPSCIDRIGHAIEARVYAEDPIRFFPSPGMLQTFVPPVGPGVRIETGYKAGCRVSTSYDPLIAKVIVKADSRDEAIERLVRALNDFDIGGVKTNIPFIQRVLACCDFREGRLSTEIAGIALESLPA